MFVGWIGSRKVVVALHHAYKIENMGKVGKTLRWLKGQGEFCDIFLDNRIKINPPIRCF